MRRDVLVAAAVGATFSAAVIAAVDAARPHAYMVTAKAVSASGGISAEAGGWSYSIPTDVAWLDARGSFHDSGRPECLPPTGKEEGPVRLKAVPVHAHGVTFRQVVYVECI